jgi:hypothetical protein
VDDGSGVRGWLLFGIEPGQVFVGTKERGQGMRGMMGLMDMMFGGPFGMCNPFGQKDDGYDILMLGILSGMAKPGDDPDMIKVNIAKAKETAKMYVDELMVQAKAEFEAADLKKKIRNAEQNLEGLQKDVTRLEKKLSLKEAALAEMDSIIEKTLGEAKAEPKSKAGQQLLMERASIANEVEVLRKDVEYVRGEMGKQVEYVAQLKGEPLPIPVQPPVAVPNLEPPII